LKYSPVYLGLGANIGQPLEQLSRALTALEADERLEILKISSIYQTEPRYFTAQPDFLNLVAEVRTDFEPIELLDYCKQLEKQLGRQPNLQRNAPREIDIDILYFANQIIHMTNLIIPHPSLTERRFVLAPLAEIAPAFVCPLTSKKISELLKACSNQSRVVKTDLIPTYLTNQGVI